MINAIKTRVMDLVEGYAQILLIPQAITNFTPFTGNKLAKGTIRDKYSRMVVNGVVTGSEGPLQDYFNLFDKPYQAGGVGERPGLYLGGIGYELVDSLEFQAVAGRSPSGAIVVEYRVIQISLIICIMDQNYYRAVDRRDAFRFNIRQLFMQHRIDSLWWHLEVGVKGGGESTERDWVSQTAQGMQGIVEACCSLPLTIHYQWSPYTVKD